MALLISNRPYRLLFSATAISNLGDGVSALAFPWLATLITRDPALIALVAFATRLPWLLLSIPAGVVVDRYDRRLLMVQADVFRLLLTGAVIALILSVPVLPPPGDPLPYILALSGLAMLLGCAEVIRDNAAQTVLPSVVAKTDLEAANGQMWSVEQIMGSFVGPPLAGILIAFAVPAPFTLDAITFGIAAWLVWCIAIPRRVAPPRRRIRPEVVEGWQWMRGHSVIFRLAIMLGLINAISTMAVTILILFSQEVLGLSAVGHGILLTAGAAGGVVGGIVGPLVVARIGGQRAVMLALALIPVPFLVIALTSNPYVVAVALFVEMIAALLWNIVTVSYRQRLIPDNLLGRVNSLYRFFGWGMMPVGALAGGWMVSLAEPELGRELALRAPYILGAVGSCLMMLYGWRKLRL
ncbi:MFS transporter [uncultured Tateyamaria sp.]|uniref:MFS transporter n=1 Tax=uncultured Tateyamaria sp. TaxID=455651 RepID=UPI0026073829|nr:MFS transporter [uncultured Tateyamaria sp.]